MCIFFMITGYFQIKKDRFNLKRVTCQIWFYSLITAVFSIICMLLGIDLIKGSYYAQIFKNITTPITANMWWFATSYIILILLSPYINRLLLSVNRNSMIAIVLVAWFVSQIGIAGSYQYNMIIFPIFYYILGAYVRLYTSEKKDFVAVKFVVLLILWGLSSALWYYRYTADNVFIINHRTVFDLCIQTVQFAFIVPAFGIIILRLFRSYKINSKIINMLGSVTFGVYLLHDSGVMRQIIWNNVFRVGEQFLSKYFWIYSILNMTGAYIICGLIDILRQIYFEKRQYLLWDKVKYCFKR